MLNKQKNNKSVTIYYLFVQMPYASSTKANDRFRIRNMKMFLDVFSDKINLKGLKKVEFLQIET